MTSDSAVGLVAELGDENRVALNLARAASFAAQIDPALLRTLRLELFPDSDASAEADLWFSSLVQTRSPKGFVLFPEVAELLRGALTEQEADAAWQIVQRCHGDSPTAVQIEEELNFLSLSPQANRTRIEQLLSSAVSALVIDSGRGLSSWAGRMLPRLPRSLREFEQGRALGLASDVRLKREGALQRRLRNDEALPPWLGQLFQDRSLVEVGVTLTELGLLFEVGATVNQRLFAPLTDPVVLELRWREAGHPRSKLVFVPANGPSPPERVPFEQLLVVTMKGDIFSIDPDAAAKRELSRVVTVRATSAAYGNLLMWSDDPTEGCIGYTIERRTRAGETTLLQTDLSPGETAPPIWSILFQTASFVDGTAPRDEVSYRVLPVHGTPSRYAPAPARSSNWTAWVKAGPDPLQPMSMYFNRGRATRTALAQSQGEAAAADSSKVWLGGDLVARFRGLLGEVAAMEGQVFGAFYDPSPTDVVDELMTLGPRAHLVLSYSEPPNKAKLALVRQLQDAGIEVVSRVGAHGTILHNKFLVITSASKQPLSVWTGNTTLSDTGFFEQQSGALALRDPELAQAFLEYWELLAATKSERAVRAGEPRAFASGQVWFSPGNASAHSDLIHSQIANAREGVLFSASLPDKSFWEAVREAANRGLYVAGIAAGRTAGTLQLFDDGELTQFSRKTVAGVGFKTPPFPISFRAIAIDPFADSATLLTGSHSFTLVASRKNEENLVMLRGQQQLTQHVAATIEGWLSEYRFRRVVSRSLVLDASGGWHERVRRHASSPRARFWLGHLATSRLRDPSAAPNVDPRVPAETRDALGPKRKVSAKSTTQRAAKTFKTPKKSAKKQTPNPAKKAKQQPRSPVAKLQRAAAKKK